MQGVLITTVKVSEACVTKTGGTLQYCRKYWLKITGRRTDDFQDFRCRGLLLKRLAQFIEQPRVLNGDDRLGGEVFKEFNLLVGERTGLLTVENNGADQLAFLEHRHTQYRPHTAEFDGCDHDRI